MEILKKIDDLLIGWGISPSRADMLDQFIAFALILAVAFLADALCRKILLKVVAQLVKKTKATWDDIVFDRKVMVHLSRMVAPVIIYLFVPLAFVEVGSSAMDFIRRICLIYIIITFLSFVNSFLKAVYSVYSEKEQFRDRPLKGMLQTMQVILWLVGGIVVVGELIGRDPLSLLAGLGASAAILMLVFKDSIMGFVSGVQLSANDMLKVGDWIEAQGVQGKVTAIQIFHTILTMVDNKVVYVPNGVMSSGVVVNYNRNDTRRVEWVVGIDYGEDTVRAEAVVREVIAADKRILADPAPYVAVQALDASSVNVVIRVWVKNSDYWGVYFDMNKTIYTVFNEEGIGFPFPQLTVHQAKD